MYKSRDLNNSDGRSASNAKPLKKNPTSANCSAVSSISNHRRSKKQRKRTSKNKRSVDLSVIDWSLIKRSDNLFEAYRNNDTRNTFEIRKFPNNLDGISEYKMCTNEIQTADHKKTCQMAHNNLEKAVWNLMKLYSINSLNELFVMLKEKSSMMVQTTKALPKIKLISDRLNEEKLEKNSNFYYSNYCRLCDLKFDDMKSFFVHRLTNKHLGLLKTCRSAKFLVRLPPSLTKLKKEHLIKCREMELSKCSYLGRDTYENFCQYPHHEIEIKQWKNFYNINKNTNEQINCTGHIEELNLEDVMLVNKTKKLKNMISFYTNENCIYMDPNDSFTMSISIEECNYETLWHRFIHNEMNSCIQLVEHIEWNCQMISKNPTRIRLEILKSQANRLGLQLMNLNDIRLSHYINILKILTESEQLKLEIHGKNFNETSNAFHFDIITNDYSDIKLNHSSKGFLLIDRSMFHMMHFAVDNVNKYLLFPKINNYNIEIQEDMDVEDDEKNFSSKLTHKQKTLIKRILNVKTGVLTPPMVVYGAFGTGKTECLAMAAERISQKHKTKVLICTYSETAAKTFFNNWNSLTNEKAIRLVKDESCIPVDSYDYKTLACSPMTKVLKDQISRARLVVTTFYSSTLLNENEEVPTWFTHILIDESVYALECEVIMPLTLATNKTTVVLVGDHKQLRPSIINNENRIFLKDNLNLLERQLLIYKNNLTISNIQNHKIENYFLMLNEVHRTVKEIVDFLSQNFYNGKLVSSRVHVDYSALTNYFPIQFVDYADLESQEEYNFSYSSFQNNHEAELIAWFVKNLISNWPKSWGQISIGIISNQNAQINSIDKKLRLVHTRLLESKSIVVNSIQNLQGSQFRIFLVSTVFSRYHSKLEENILHNYLLSPYAANACLTRCEECLVVFGKCDFLANVRDYFSFSMQVFWKNLIDLTLRKKSYYKAPFDPHSENLYFKNFKYKLMENKRSKLLKEKPIDKDNYFHNQFTEDLILNELTNCQEQPAEDKVDQASHINFLDDSKTNSEDETDQPLSRRTKKTNLLVKKNPTKKGADSSIKCFNFDEKVVSSRRRLVFSAETALYAADDDVDVEKAEKILKYSANSNNKDTSSSRRSYYNYVNQISALKLVDENPLKYKKCIIEYENSESALARCQADNSVYKLNSRYNCGPSYSGDECVIEILNSEGLKNYARVISIVERAEPIQYRRFICEPDEFEPYGMMKPLDKLSPKIYIVPKTTNKFYLYEVDQKNEECTFIKTEQLTDIINLNSRMYMVVLLDWSPDLKYPRGVITQILKSATNVSEGLSLLNSMYDLDKDYVNHDTELQKLEETLNPKLNSQVKTNKRLDLTSLFTFTIDPEDSKDLDDALSCQKLNLYSTQYYKIGVHIADVSEYLEKNGSIDQEAKRRGNTFYHQSKQYYPMLPDNFSNNLLSLLPGKKRATLSLIFLMDEKATVCDDPTVLELANLKPNFENKFQIANALICSEYKLSYKQAEAYVNKTGDNKVLNQICSSLFNLSEKLKRERYHSGHLFVNESSCFEDFKSHSLIEQFMILTNSVIGRFLVTSTNNPLNRAQSAPDLIKLKAWNDFNTNLLPISFAIKKHTDCAKSFLNIENNGLNSKPELSSISTTLSNFETINRICKAIGENSTNQPKIKRDLDQLSFHIKSEMHYPTFASSILNLRNLTNPAKYLCSNESDITHFDLNLDCYTHFTSPIRRYIDLVVHRLVKSIINKEKMLIYSKRELELISNTCNLRMHNAKKFESKLKALSLGEHLESSPLRCYAFISSLSDTSIKLFYPFLKCDSNENLKSFKYAMLSPCKQPYLTPSHVQLDDEEKSFSKCSLNWSLQIFDAKRQSEEFGEKIESSSNLRINLQSLYAANIPIGWWEKVHKAIEADNAVELEKLAKTFKSPAAKQRFKKSSLDIKSSSTDSLDKQRFFTEFKTSDILCVQLAAEVNEGFLSPKIQLVSLTKSIDLCIEHKRNALKCFRAQATRPVKDSSQIYESIKEYLEIWLPLIYMETTECAIKNCEENFLIRNCKVGWFYEDRYHPISNKLETFLFGKVILNKDNFNMDFIDLTENCIAGKLSKHGHPTFVLAYACVQYKGIKATEKSKSYYKSELDSKYIIDEYTWVGHCAVTWIDDKPESQVNLYLAFPEPEKKFPLDLNKNTCNIELMRKPYPDSVMESALRSLILKKSKITDLCKKIIIGDITKENLNSKFDKNIFETYLKECHSISKVNLNKPNEKQYEAMLTAFSQDFSLIQGPPGTGKTITGLILSHCFFQHNQKEFVKSGAKKTILYVSASNRAVDVFGNYLMKRFKLLNEDEGNKSGKLLSAIRIYSQQIQNNEYPNPNFFNKLKSPSKKSENSDKANVREAEEEDDYDTNHSEKSLQKIVLHHVIRNEGKPYAKKLRKIDEKLSILREYQDRLRNRLCCCGNKLSDFQRYDSLKCEHARYFKHVKKELSFQNLLEKDQNLRNMEEKFLFLKLIIFRSKELAKRSTEDETNLINNVMSKLNNLNRTILDGYLKKLEKGQFLNAIETFLNSLEMEDCENRISYIITSKNRAAKRHCEQKFNFIRNKLLKLKHYPMILKQDYDYKRLLEQYYYPEAARNTLDDLLARFYADNNKNMIALDISCFEEYLDQAAAITWTNINQYEVNLFHREMEKFKIFEKDENVSTIKKMTTEYNELLELACNEEIKRHDIILSTCIASHMKAISEVTIEQLIVDEAAMIKEPEVLVPIIFCKPKKVVLIGDHKQLRCIIKCSQAADLDFDRSLFERYHKNLTMLEEQYRMHPSICKFPSAVFYNKNLITGTNGPFQTQLFWPKKYEDEKEFLRMGRKNGKGYDEKDFKSFRIVFLDVKGTETKLSVSSSLGSENSVRNEEEIKCTEKLFSLLKNNNIEKKDIKILSPYRSQVAAIASTLKLNDANVSTVITSQGGEWNYVILSTVRTLQTSEINQKPTIGWRKKYLGFLCDEHQINVALTRAKRGLFIIGDKELLATQPIWSELFKYLKDSIMRPEDYFRLNKI